ncbi:septum site-determining protein Ssd [Prescottella defluvii]|uniref:septum site-determining protein Ssd n=1 Tax=Prescottella defluvii TaxID=1323361 RepID=UPI0012E064F3|nr:septum site-determining protein Ssd [Prescottella defluvii]
MGLPARRVWEGAGLVVVDAAAARECATRLPRRDRVLLVCDGPPTLPDWQAATAVGAESVLGIPDDEAALVAAFGDRSAGRQGDGTVVAVIGGCGGAGASVLAAAVAVESVASRDSRDHGRTAGSATAATILLDADPMGGGVDLLLGLENTPGPRWSGLTVEAGQVSADALHAALPSPRPGVGVLACDRGRAHVGGPTPAAATAVAEAGRRAGDLVVCDIPRHASAASDSLLDIADMVVAVVPATVRAGMAAERVLARVAERNPHQGIVVRGPAPGGLRGADLADTIGVPLLATMRPEPHLDVMLERGGLDLGSRSPLGAAARAVLGLLGARPRRWSA